MAKTSPLYRVCIAFVRLANLQSGARSIPHVGEAITAIYNNTRISAGQRPQAAVGKQVQMVDPM